MSLTEELRDLPLRARLDPFHGIVAVGLGLGSLGLLLGATLVASVLGVFDPPELRRLPDRRVLTNVRDGGDFVDALVHPASGALFVLDAAGRVHRLDPGTDLWRTHAPADPGGGGAAPLVELVAGCTEGPVGETRCTDDEALWGRGEDGGLVLARDERFETARPVSRWLDAEGRPVETQALTAAGLSEDGRWLALGTRSGEVGLHDLEAHRFVAPDWRLPGEGRVAHLRWWKGAFWIGRSAGLARLDPERATLELVDDVNGSVEDLEAADSLWVLETRPCDNDVDGCLRLVELADPDAAPVARIDERERHPELTMQDLRFARQEGDRLLVGGRAGLFRYDLRTHSWRRLSPLSVRAVLEGPAPGELHLGTASGVLHYLGGEIRDNTRLQLGAGDLTGLVHHGDGSILALGESGAIAELLPGDRRSTRVVHPGISTEANPASFERAVAVGSSVLFLGPERALLHDVEARTYLDATDAGAAWLGDPETLLLGTGSVVFGVSRDGELARVHAVRSEAIVSESGYALPGPAPRWPVRRLREWRDGVASLVSEDGGVLALSAAGTRTLVGGPIDLDWSEVRDVAVSGTRLAVATARGLRVYDGGTRSWSEPIAADVAGGSFVDVELRAGGGLLAVGEEGRVVAVERGGREARVVVGDGEPGLGGARPSDALRVGDRLFVGGGGRIARYDLARRSFDAPIELVGTGPVELVGWLAEQPVALTSGIAHLGARPLAPELGPVRSVSLEEGRAWTLRDDAGRRFLWALEPGADPASRRCLFASPTLEGRGGRVLDARELAPDWLAVATDSGLGFYDARSRSWHRAPADRLPRGGRLHRIGARVAVVEHDTAGDGARIELLDPEALPRPDSCSRAVLELPSRPVEALAVAVDEEAGRAAWLGGDGALWSFAGVRTERLLPPPGEGPRRDAIRRVYRVADGLLATTAGALWHYPESERRWRRHELAADGATLVDVNVEDGAGDRLAVTAVTERGGILVGSLDPDDPDAPVPLRALLLQPSRRLAAPGGELVDVVEHDGEWLFLFEDRLERFDPAERRWTASVDLERRDPRRTLHRIGDTLVLLAADGREAWLARPEALESARRAAQAFVRLELAAGDRLATSGGGAASGDLVLYRLATDGALERCALPVGAARGATAMSALGCVSRLPAAPRLDPSRLRAAHALGELVLLRVASGFRAIDRAAHIELSVVGAPAGSDAAAFEVRRLGDELWLGAPDGRALRAALTTARASGVLRFEAVPPDALPARLGDAAPVPDQAARVVGWIENGRLDPARALERADPGGALVARAPSGPVPLGEDAEVGLEGIDPLASGWVRFDRARRAFELQTVSGPERMAAADFVRDGLLLFEGASAALVAPDGSTVLANRHGLWHHPDGLDLRLATVRFEPVELGPDVVAAHGRFATPERVVSVPGFASSGSGGRVLVELGAARLEEEIATGRVRSWLAGDADGPPALDADGGFRFDRRRGLRFEDGTLLLETDAGPVPEGALTPVGGSAPARRSVPGAERELLATSRWTWSADADGVHVRAGGDGPDPGLLQAPGRIGFRADRLRSASAHAGRLFVLTEATLEIADGAEALAEGRARRLPAPPGDVLESLATGPDERTLLLRDADRTLRWRADDAGFEELPGGEDPGRRRPRVRAGRLRIARVGDSIETEIAVDVPGEGRRWVPAPLSARGFPFDRVTALGRVGERVALGSALGVAVHPDDALGVEDMVALVGATGAPGGSTSPVRALGRPASAPGRLRALLGDSCVESADGERFAPCTEGSSVRRWSLGETPAWRWERDERGRVRGSYLAPDGTEIGPVAFVRGRFAHDELVDVLGCAGVGDAAIERSGWLDVHPGDAGLAWDGTATRIDRSAARPSDLVCLPAPVRTTGAALEPGLYVLSRDGAAHLSGDALEEVTDAAALAELDLRREGPPLVDGATLRLPRSRRDGGFRFLHQAEDGVWRPLEWRDEGHLAIDRYRTLLSHSGRLWAGTSGGIVLLGTDGPDGTLRLDPDALTVVAPPEGCDGVTQLAPAEDGAVRFRCDDSSAAVYRVRLAPGRSRPAIEGPEPHDPFASRSELETPYWEWRVEDRRDGGSGELVAWLGDEELWLLGGRFAYDSIASLTVGFDGGLELAGAPGGWFRVADPEDLHVERIRRPEGVDGTLRPRAVLRIVRSRSSDGTELCVETGAGSYGIDASGALTPRRRCVEDLGSDGPWRFGRTESRFLIDAAAVNGGLVERELVDGRFADDVVLGRPRTRTGSDGAETLLPTRAGVIVLDERARARAVYATGRAPLAPCEAPGRLRIGAGNEPRCAPPEAPDPLAATGTRAVDASGWPELRRHQGRVEGASGALELDVRCDAVELAVPALQLRRRIALPTRCEPGREPLLALVTGSRLLVVTPEDLLEIDLGRTLHELYADAR